MVPEKIMTPGC